MFKSSATVSETSPFSLGRILGGLAGIALLARHLGRKWADAPVRSMAKAGGGPPDSAEANRKPYYDVSAILEKKTDPADLDTVFERINAPGKYPSLSVPEKHQLARLLHTSFGLYNTLETGRKTLVTRSPNFIDDLTEPTFISSPPPPRRLRKGLLRGEEVPPFTLRITPQFNNEAFYTKRKFPLLGTVTTTSAASPMMILHELGHHLFVNRHPRISNFLNKHRKAEPAGYTLSPARKKLLASIAKKHLSEKNPLPSYLSDRLAPRLPILASELFADWEAIKLRSRYNNLKNRKYQKIPLSSVWNMFRDTSTYATSPLMNAAYEYPKYLKHRNLFINKRRIEYRRPKTIEDYRSDVLGPATRPSPSYLGLRPMVQ